MACCCSLAGTPVCNSCVNHTNYLWVDVPNTASTTTINFPSLEEILAKSIALFKNTLYAQGIVDPLLEQLVIEFARKQIGVR